MEYYLVITNAEGESRIVPISDVTDIPVDPGDDVVVMDSEGNPVDVSLRPEEEDLVLTFPDGEKATLLDFYETGPGEEPTTISLNPTLPEDTSYEFNSQTGNLPDGLGFSLMRFSNTEYVQFVEQIDELAVGALLGGLNQPRSPGAGGGGGGGEGGNLSDFDLPEQEDLILDPAPDARADAGSGLEDGSPIVLNLLANDVDARGEGLVIHSVGGIDVEVGSKVTLSTGTVITVGNGGTVSVEPGEDFDFLQEGESTTETFVYTVRDAGGNLDTSRATVTIFGVNDAPEANPDLYSLSEDAPITVEVLENDTDPDTNDSLTVTNISTPSAGLATLNADSSVTFDPNGEFDNLALGETATVTLEYTITDEHGATSTTTATFVIEGANDAPDAIDDTAASGESTPVTIDALDNDVDPDASDSLEIIGVTQPSGGSASYNAGDLTFDPGSDFEYLGVGETATVTFSYTISDGNGGTDTANVTVTVNGEDDPTITAPDAAETSENTPVIIDVLANDSDADASDNPLTIDTVTPPALGSVINNGGNITFDPGTDFDDLAKGETATVTFTYTTDTGVTENVTVTVHGRNDAPDAVDDARATDQNTALVIDAVANDIDPDDSDVLIITGVDQPVTGSVSINSDNRLVFDPGDDFDYLDDGETATVTFDYSISDGNGGTDTATVTVTVTGTEDATEIAPDSAATREDTAVTIDVLANDSDPDANDNPLTIAAVDGPVDANDGTVVINGGADVTFTPGSNFDSLAVGETATTTFTYTTNTGASEAVTITITGTNDGPTAVADTGATDQNTTLTIDALDNDTDPDTSDSLTITGLDQPALGSVSIDASGELVFDPGDDFDYLDDGETATVTFDYSISDGNGGTDSATVTVTVTGTEDATVIAPDSATTKEGTAVTIDVLSNDSDPDANDNPLTIAAVDGPVDANDGTVAINGGADVTFTPGSNFDSLAVGETATTTFTYTTNTGASETVTVTVTGTNDGPVAVNDTGTVGEDATTTIDLLANDSDPDTSDALTVTQINGISAGGTITLASGALLTVNGNGTVDYDPNGQFDGLDAGETATDTFDYTISDGNGGTATATATVTINGEDDALVANPDSASTGENATVTIDVLSNDSDPDTTDNPLTINSFDPTSSGGGTVNQVGQQLVFDPGTDFDDLAAGETEIVTFDYVVENTDGATQTETVTVTVTGTNDGPVAVDDTDAVNEDATINVSVADGVIQGPGTDTDLDGSDVLTVTAVENSSSVGALVGNPLVGVYGTLTLNSDGSYSYAADQDAADPLAVGETATDSFTYTISDGNGATDTATLTITVTGTNDGPAPNPPGGTSGVDPGIYDDENTIAEDTVSVGGNVLDNDVDLDTSDVLIVSAVGGVPGNVDSPVNGVFGDVTINQDGSYDYVLDNTDPLVQGLAVGETLTETFSYTASDQNGGTAMATLTITITGTNDAPVANPGVGPGVYDEADSISEDDFPNTIDGNVLDNDSDPDGDTLTVSEVKGLPGNVGSQISGDFGAITINSDGSYSYVLNNGNAAVNGLDDGETLTDSFTYVAEDGNGGSATATLTITINGTDDATVINPDSAETGENTSVVIDVLDNDSDPDDTLIIASVDDSSLPGDASVTNNITDVTFNPGTAFDGLAEGETEIVTFTYTTNTGSTETVTVTVNGVNDAPDAVDDDRTTDQNSVLTIDALANDTDADTTDNLVIVGFDQPAQGSVTLDGSGNFVFDPEGDFDFLNVGETTTASFDYTISDGNGGTDTATVTVTVTGVDDATVTAPDADTTDEDAPVTIDVLANDSDADDNDNPLSVASVTQPADANDGTAAVGPGGANVTFTPGTNFQSLAVGESATTVFTYTTDTGAVENVTVTVYGTNDAPTANPDADTTDQNSTVTIDVTDNDTDPDASDELIVTGVDQPSRGTVTIDSGNNVVFDPDGDFDDLDVGETATVTFDYNVTDGNGGTSTATVTVTVTGAEDATVTNPDADETDEDTAVTIDVLANDSDPDASDNPLSVASVTQPADANDGTAVVGPGGANVIFTPGSNFQSLSLGASATTTITYTTDTGVTENVTVTVFGANDDPAANPDLDATDQNTAITIDVLTNDTDLDNNDTLLVTGVTQPTRGTVTYNVGDVSFDPDGEFDYLAAGETATVTFTYDITDGKGGTDTATVTVTVTGTDDATDTNPDAAVTNEDTAVVVNVLANDSDPDTNDNPLSVASVAQPADTDDGVATTDGTSVTFTPGANFDSLSEGESATTTFTYTTDTGATETVTITVNGANDAPTAVADIETTDQNNVISIDVIGNDIDPDTSDNLVITSVNQPDRGIVSINASNQISFDPDGKFDDLGTGESATVTFDYSISDGHGGTDTATVTITINGIDDATDTAPDSVTTNEDTAVTVDVLANDSDVDSNDNPLSVASVTQPADANDGTAAVGPGGANVVFTPGSNFQSLAIGETATTTFTYTTDTGATENVTVTITGRNDAPTANNDLASTTEGTPVTIDVLDNDTDPDTSDLLEVIGVIQPSKGSVTYNAGDLTFNPGTAFNDLGVGETETVTFTYTMADEHGVTDTATVTVTVNGADAPTVTNPDFDDTNEGAPVTIDVLDNDSDPDASDNPLLIASVTQPADANDGTVVNNGGNLTFTPGSNFESLAVGESATTTFTYTTDTGVTENVTVTVQGRNDAPNAVNDTGATDQETTIVIDAIANDTDIDTSDNLVITSVDQPTRGTVSVNAANRIVFNPDGEFDRLDAGETEIVTFGYTISDGNGGTDTATVSVTVTGVDDPTDTNPDQATTFEGSPVTVNVLANDSDPDSNDNPLTIAAITQPADANDGTAVINGGNITFTPGSNFSSLSPGESATTSFTYTTDTGATETVTIIVNGLDSPTITQPDFETTGEDSAVTINVLSNDSDPDTADNPLAINGVTQPADSNDGIVVNNGTSLTFTPGDNFDSLSVGETATTMFTYTTDTGVTEWVTVTLTGVNDNPSPQDDFIVSTTDIVPVVIDVVSNDTDIDGTIDPATVDLDPTTAGIQTSLTVAGEGTWTTDGNGNVIFTPQSGINDQPSSITYAVSDNNGATGTATLTLNYSAADVWFGNDESGSVDSGEFPESRALMSGAANQMTFAAGDVGFNAALYSWGETNQQQMVQNITDDQTQFVNTSGSYSRNYSRGTDLGQAIVFGNQQINAHVSQMQSNGDPRADVPQVLVILTDASRTQIANDSSLVADAQAAKADGIILVFVLIDEAQDFSSTVAFIENIASQDQNGDPLVVTADTYADIDAGSIADLLNAIREAAAAGLLPPVVIDMDGDGVEFDSVEDGILFDVDGDGQDEKVAWADEDDAVLVYDENNNNDVDGIDEISFARYSDDPDATDLEGLRHFDTNDDLILDANDAEFESFKLWQDRDGDGIVDDGEMMTLREAGIESLELVSDGDAYHSAGGDVFVHGEAGVNYEDGSKGTLADAEFAYEELASDDHPIEVITDEGEVLNLSESDTEIEDAAPDLVEGCPPAAEPIPEECGGAIMPTSAEEDAAAADSAMG